MLALLCYYILTQPNPSATDADARELEAYMQAKEARIADVAKFADELEADRQLALGRKISPFEEDEKVNPFAEDPRPDPFEVRHTYFWWPAMLVPKGNL